MTIFVHHVRNVLLRLPLSPRMKTLIDHPAGPLTIFFWCPFVKWMITFANIKDFKRPVENVSLNQQIAIFVTGAIWTRYCMVITPVNYSLMAVNATMGATGFYQICRKVKFYQQGGVDTAPAAPAPAEEKAQ
ncbi:unnamed protein product [Moneuplotes crassus]|uniref:Mitochondrial pyruvate carrier n=1 Tax=Euplotes crassus TaxID=5936 RepID=A0AAD1Y4V6_EUPCR|nr:unnamed protein product [Moneuplotes crassus]